jgi:hypothetical protein
MGKVWSQFPLQPLTPGALTPFSYSVLAELASRAWYLYYDRLGFDPTPRSKVVRRHKGHLYFNLSLCAQMEADHAGREPLMLRINGERYPLATWEKPGLLAGFKLGRAQKKLDDTLLDNARQMDAITDKARTWYLKTQGIQRWGQAEVLQIMEEIERVGVDSMVAFLAARLNLGHLYSSLVTDLLSKATGAHAVLLINNTLGGISGLVESAMIDALPPIAETLRDPSSLAWLRAGHFTEWRSELPSKDAVEQLKNFMSLYGHRAVHEGEMSNPRWSQDATLLMQSLLAQIETPSTKPAPPAPNAALHTLLDHLPPSARKQGEQNIKRIGELHKLQSRALHALAYVLAGTRSWALAAAREAMVDKRLHSTDEAFLFELEEIKQMMTGEWNISSLDEIRAAVAKRQAEQAALQAESAPKILVDDTEGNVTHTGLPGVVGKVSAPLSLWDTTQQQQDCRGVIVASELLDSGYALALPYAAGFVAAGGNACDPFMVAAQAWRSPVAYAVRKNHLELTNGLPTVLTVSTDGVVVSQG